MLFLSQDDVQSMVFGISNAVLLIMLAQGQKKIEERQAAEQRRAASTIEGGQEG